MVRRIGMLASAAALAGSVALGQDLIPPAELPPEIYKGQQYVDSRGCLFLRAGSGGQTVWVPRVTRQGESACGYPPSGRRVPVVGDALAPPTTGPDDAAGKPIVAEDTLLIAVGSFARARTADRAKQQIAALGLPVVRGRPGRRETLLITVYAGPFATQVAAEAALRSVQGAGFANARIVRD